MAEKQITHAPGDGAAVRVAQEYVAAYNPRGTLTNYGRDAIEDGYDIARAYLAQAAEIERLMRQVAKVEAEIVTLMVRFTRLQQRLQASEARTAAPPEKMMLDEIAQAIRDAFPHQVVGRHGRPAWKDMLECDKDTWRKMASAAEAARRLSAPIKARTMSDNDTPLTPALLLSAVGAMRPYSRERMAQEILLAILRGSGLMDIKEAKLYIKDYLNALDEALKPDA